MSEERKNIIFDSQILNAVQACGMKTHLQFNLDLRTPTTPIYFEEGDLLHKMFEQYNLVLKEKQTEVLYDNDAFEKLVKDIIEMGQAYAVTKDLLPAEAAEVIFQWEKYVRFTRMDGVKILEVERPFIVEIHKDDILGVYYTGKIDRMTETPNYGIVPRDYKKAAQHREPDRLSNQFTGYCFATGADTIIVDKVGFQKTKTPEERFRSYPLTYTKYQIDRWKNQTIWWARQYAFYIETGTWPENRTSCDKYSGCEYKPICDAGTDEARDWIIKSKFVVGDKWDPTNILREGNK